VLFVLSVSIAYLLGAFPPAHLIARVTRGIDIREYGSGNVGALNVYRHVGRRGGGLAFILDTAKGAVAVLIPRWLGAPDMAMYIAAIVVVVGHNWSVFLRFSGGKGVATVFGVTVTVIPILAMVTLPPAMLLMVVLRSSVMGMVVAFIALNILTIVTGQSIETIIVCLILTLVVAVTHFGREANIYVRLFNQKRWNAMKRVE
jgi:glycerol-3-phosphate acyltransferase PlsY